MDPCTSSIFDSFAPELQILGYNFAGAVTDQRIQEIAQVLQGKGVTNNPNKAVPLDLLVEYFQPQMPHPLDIDALTLALLTLGIEVGPTGREDEPQWTVGIDFNTERIQYDVIQTFVTNAKELELLTPEETQISFDPSKIFSLPRASKKLL
ncbi:MAG: hypothetical protein LVR00_05220 [Rhabdochlamydiaceae bacterium]|jgi:hypothetical protein